ncbi:hypothetical protein [Pseudonocardia sp. H11422]|uniref:hypothetical protein n=1 Tax=Pseudonocardia sp. H11422 TaxID=2835866 RepID=UPI001BDCF275|nr:hypothetical protein [Pseudonocardia sp. H11422]
MSTPTPPPDDRPAENVTAQAAAPPTTRRRRRWILGGAAAAVLLVLAGVTAALVSGGPGRHQHDRDTAAPRLTAGESRFTGEDLGGRDLLGDGRRGLGSDTLLVGTVAAVGGGTLAVDRDAGGRTTVRTDDRTQVRGGGPDDLRAGERVVVRVRGTGDTATAVVVATPRAHVTGTVTELDGARATVVEAAGLTATVDVSGLTTRPAVGDLVTLSGASAEGGATLRAETLRTLPQTG